MLKRKKLAQVDEHFVNLMFDIYHGWMDNHRHNASRWPGGEEAYFERNSMKLARVQSLLHGADGDGRSGRTYEITKLRALQFVDFKAVGRGEIRYLVGQTKPIVIEVGRNSRRIEEGTYHLGPYKVYVADEAILEGNLDAIHMVPLKAPFAQNRFMHHTSFINGAEHPLDYRTHTCWGSFGTIIKTYAVEADIPELFRALYMYLSRYDISSPLANIDTLGWDVKTPWEEFHGN
jgi:hypothetical protein